MVFRPNKVSSNWGVVVRQGIKKYADWDGEKSAWGVLRNPPKNKIFLSPRSFWRFFWTIFDPQKSPNWPILGEKKYFQPNALVQKTSEKVFSDW